MSKNHETGLQLRVEVRRRAQDRVDRIERVRAVQQLHGGGCAVAKIAAEVGVSDSTVRRWLRRSPGPTVEEVLDRAAVDGAPRREVLDQLSGLEYTFHGEPTARPVSDTVSACWSHLAVAVHAGLLLPVEYLRACDSMCSLAATTMARPPCNPRTCAAHEEHLYIICYGRPTVTCYSNRDWHPLDRRGPADNYPISHYVGWTRQHPPIRRVRQHGAKSAHYLALVVPGTTYEEEVLKTFGRCPSCGGSLDYHAENPARSAQDPYAMAGLTRPQDHANSCSNPGRWLPFSGDRVGQLELDLWGS